MMYLLQPGKSVALPAQLLVVRVQGVTGQPPPRLEAVVTGPGGVTPAEGGALARGPLVLSVTQPTTVRLRPGDGREVFGPGSVFSVSVQTEGVDSSTVTLQGVDAGGLRQRDLVLLTPDGDEVRVRAVAQVRDLPLPPTADRARRAAREHLGVPRLPTEQTVDMSVVVDVSASMKPFVTTGELEHALEVLVGVGQVIAGVAAPAVACCAQTWSALRPGSAERWASDVVEAVGARPAVIGFRSSQVPTVGPRSRTYVLTDAMPADLPMDRADPLHLVLLTGGGIVPSRTPTASAVTVLPPSSVEGNGSGEHVSAMVRSLLAGIDPPREEPYR